MTAPESELTRARRQLRGLALVVGRMRDGQSHREHEGRLLTVTETCRLEAWVDNRVAEILGASAGVGEVAGG